MPVLTRKRKWADIRRHAPDSPGVVARGEAMKAAERLAVLRETRGVTQTELAKQMGVRQPSISELERRDDAYLSTLRDYVEALGGRLRLVAEFDDDSYEVGIGPSDA